jgi:hypothetical protein
MGDRSARHQLSPSARLKLAGVPDLFCRSCRKNAGFDLLLNCAWDLLYRAFNVAPGFSRHLASAPFPHGVIPIDAVFGRNRAGGEATRWPEYVGPAFAAWPTVPRGTSFHLQHD